MLPICSWTNQYTNLWNAHGNVSWITTKHEETLKKMFKSVRAFLIELELRKAGFWGDGKPKYSKKKKKPKSKGEDQKQNRPTYTPGLEHSITSMMGANALTTAKSLLLNSVELVECYEYNYLRLTLWTLRSKYEFSFVAPIYFLQKVVERSW